MSSNNAKRQRSALLPSLGSLAVVCLLGACDGAIEDPPQLPTIDNVEENPTPFIGKEVTLTGEVDEVYSDRAFELEEMQWIFDSEVLVLTRTPVNLGVEQIEDDRLVSVRGTVRKFVVAEIEADLGWDVDNKLEIAWRDKPVVVAERIDALESYAHWSEKEEPAGTLVSLWAITARPLPVEMTGAKVSLQHLDVVEKGQTGVWVGVDGQPDLFVVPEDEGVLAKLEADQHVDVAGMVKRLPASAPLPDDWKLSDSEKSRLADGALFIEASQLTPAAKSAAGERSGQGQPVHGQARDEGAKNAPARGASQHAPPKNTDVKATDQPRKPAPGAAQHPADAPDDGA